MNFYKILKIKKLGRGSPDFWSRLFAKHTGGGSIKPIIVELTGKLPLTFITSDTKLHDWTIYGNNEPGKNLLEITTENQVHNGVSFIVDKAAGTVTATRVNTAEFDSIFAIDIPNNLKGQKLYFSGCPTGGSVSTYDIYALDYTAASRAPQWDGTTSSATDYGQSNNHEVKFVEGHRSQIRLRIKAGYDAQNVVFKPMLRRADTSEAFEPYQIGVGERTKNLLDIDTSTTVQINSQGHLRYGVSIGSALAGTYILSFTNTSAYTIYVTTRKGTTYSQSIAITVSPHTITLNNNVDELIVRTTSPTMTTWEGVGFTNIMLVEGSTAPDHYIPYGYQIPLTISQQGQTDKMYDIYIGDSPLTEGETVSKSSTGVDIELFEGENTVSTTLYNKPNTSVTYLTTTQII